MYAVCACLSLKSEELRHAMQEKRRNWVSQNLKGGADQAVAKARNSHQKEKRAIRVATVVILGPSLPCPTGLATMLPRAR